MIKQQSQMRGFYYNYNWRIHWPNYYAGGRRCANYGVGDSTCSNSCRDLCYNSGYRYCTLLWRTSYCCNGGRQAVGCLMGNSSPRLFHPNHNGYYRYDRSDHWVRRGRRLTEGETESTDSESMFSADSMSLDELTQAPEDYESVGNLLAFEDHQKMQDFLAAMETHK